MPASVVKTKEDEGHWEEAKKKVREEYPDVAEGSDRFYSLVMTIFKAMSGRGSPTAKARVGVNRQAGPSAVLRRLGSFLAFKPRRAPAPGPRAPQGDWTLGLQEEEIGKAAPREAPGGHRGARKPPLYLFSRSRITSVTVDPRGRILLKAEVAHRDVGRGELSGKTRQQIGRVGSEQREDMPEHVFLLPGERKYPVKVKRDGKWIYSLKLLLAAARRARMQGREDLARRADAIRERLGQQQNAA